MLLEESKEAEEFSEQYFQALYQQKLDERLLSDKKRETISIDFAPFKLHPIYTEKMTEEQIQEVEKDIRAQQESLIKNIKKYKYNEKVSTDQFKELFLDRVERAKEVLPDDILKDIKDLRVFALDKATREIIKRVESFCEQNEKIVNKTTEDYRKQYKRIRPKLDKSIIENMNFHDCKVEKVSSNEGMLELHLDNSGGFTDVARVRFDNHSIIKQEGSLEKAWWLYDEIYPMENGYEVHVLLENKHRSLIDFILTAQGIQFFMTRS